MDIETRRIELAEGELTQQSTPAVITRDKIGSWIWPAGPFYPVQRICGWGLLLTFVGSIVVGFFMGSDGLRLAFIWGYFVTPWLIVGFVGSWFLDTIISYLKA